MRLYVLIDETLDPIYGCVQGSHAVAQYLIENGNKDWSNDYLVFLKCNLQNTLDKLENKGISYTPFTEPDLDNKLTAIAVLNNGNTFRNYKLIGT